MLKTSAAKINLGLYITDKREDGYHNLESIFLPIAFYDAVELIPADKNDLSTYGLNIPGKKSSNSVLLSLELMQQKYGMRSYHIHLLKNIPIGAGLGGGSSNSAMVIKLINELEELKLSTEEMISLALEIGSDNAFFVESKAKYVSGRGENIKDCQLKAKDYKVVLIIPPFHQSTREAYQNVAFNQPDFDLQQVTIEHILNKDLELINSFQNSFIERFPSTKSIIETLEASGAIFSSLSGSGSAFYGIYRPNQDIPKSLNSFAKANGYYYQETTIL